MTVELESKFEFGQEVWAVSLENKIVGETMEYVYVVIGPAPINWIDCSMNEPGKLKTDAYGLEGFHRHDGFYPDNVFATPEEAQAQADHDNRCYDCGNSDKPLAPSCEVCPHSQPGQS